MKIAVVALGLLFMQLVYGDMYLHNPRGSNNRLNEDGKTRTNAKRLFDSQNNDNGGYNVGDKTASASSSEATQYNMAYFQSGKHYKTSNGLVGKSLLEIEWTNQHGCDSKDLNCNFVIQYRCQEDEKHQTLNKHSMRNGKATSTPQHTYKEYSSRSVKDSTLNSNSANFANGLHEPWEWYDKCTKRRKFTEFGSAVKQCRKTNNGKCCVFPFIYGGKKYYNCIGTGSSAWCATTSSYDRDTQWGTCTGGYSASVDKTKSSIYTRQNPQGTQYGYECPEERDYYPYWHPSDWTDIAVLTDDTSICSYYKNESFNVKPKGECLEYYSGGNDGFRHDSYYNNKIDCEKNKGVWVEFSNFLELYPQAQTEAECEAASTKVRRLIWGVPYRSENIDKLKIKNNTVKSLERCLVALDPPECFKTTHSRSNHLGNVHGVVPQRYTWVLPYFPSGKAQRCVLRARYNISSGDLPPFDPVNGQSKKTNQRYYELTNNPTVKVGYTQFSLQLSINTAQFGRVFQDRSHLFKLLPRPKSVSNDDVIYNLNVRGKRGNIVQTFPAVEYDFVPKRLSINAGGLIHIQWTGSNTNPAGNAGQGTDKTDRNNMVEMPRPSVNYPIQSGESSTMFKNAEIVWSSDTATTTKEDIILSMASSGYYTSASFCQPTPSKTLLDALLNIAPASYRGMLLRFAPGTYYYMCTRNNSFTNRNQKGRINVYTNGTVEMEE